MHGDLAGFVWGLLEPGLPKEDCFYLLFNIYWLVQAPKVNSKDLQGNLERTLNRHIRLKTSDRSLKVLRWRSQKHKGALSPVRTAKNTVTSSALGHTLAPGGSTQFLIKPEAS